MLKVNSSCDECLDELGIEPRTFRIQWILDLEDTRMSMLSERSTN